MVVVVAATPVKVCMTCAVRVMKISVIKAVLELEFGYQHESSFLKCNSLQMWEEFFIHVIYGYAQSPVLGLGWGTQSLGRGCSLCLRDDGRRC